MTRLRWAIVMVVLVAFWEGGAFYEFNLIEIPEGHRGPVVIFYGHPSGTRPSWGWGAKRFYRVPADGVLRIKSEMTLRRPTFEAWVFVSPAGKLTPIPDLNDIDKRKWSSITYPVITQDVSAVQGDLRWMQAYIFVPSDRDAILENPYRVAEKVRDEIENLKGGAH